jgi:tRNA-specific adenosine deaminase 1
MKCLPASKIPFALGNVLHDWHAEIVALRSLNHFLLEECRALVEKKSSNYVRHRTSEEITDKHFQPFTLKEDIKLHMYCSEAPCMNTSLPI